MANSVINGHTSIYSSLLFLFSLSSFLLQPLPTSLSTPSSLHAGALKNPQQQQRIEIHGEIPSNKDNLMKDIQSSILTNSSWSWQDEDDPSSSRGTSWFKKQYSAKDSKRSWTGNRGTKQWGRRGFQFCEEDDVDVENIFRDAFGGNRFFYWSFIDEENPQWRSSSTYNNYGRSWKWNWRHRTEETYDSSSDYESLESDLASDRLALGLSASGPLKLEDVKNAYRVCALKWHPDRHQGSSKAVAEEKFKHCSAAYQSLCDKLAVD